MAVNDVRATTFHVNNENENLLQSSNQRRAPPLPPGKEFHVFFSHSSEDREWVVQMVNKLESPEFGFRCCLAGRDFDLGARVFENATKYTNLSKKTVIVLTPQFLQSPWYSYETRITMEMEMDKKQRLLVPIMLRNCQVPDFIGKLSYIEVDNEHFWGRFLQAINGESYETFNEPVKSDAMILGGPVHPNPDPYQTFIEPVRSDAMIPGGPVHPNPNFTNTDVICESVVLIRRSRRGVLFQSIDAYVMPKELEHSGLQLTAEDYKGIIGILSANRHLRQREKFYTACFWISLAVFECFGITVTAVACIVSGTLFPLAILFIMIFMLVVGCVFRYLMMRGVAETLQKTTTQANTIAIRHNMMVGCTAPFKCDPVDTGRDSICIVFMYYEWSQCHSYMKQILQNVNEEKGRGRRFTSENVSLSTFHGASENIETQVEKFLLHHATEYGQLLLKGQTQCPSEQRHTRQKECLCQFIERSAME